MIPPPHAARDAPVAPVAERLEPAPDPEEAFLRLAGLPGVVFLDSAARQDPVHARYSYLTALPFETLRARETTTRVLRPASDRPLAGCDEETERIEGPPLRALAARIGRWRLASRAGLPPFQGGAAGVLAYELGRTLEDVPPPRRDEFELPHLAIGLYDWVLAWDHRMDRCWIVSTGLPAPESERPRRAAARARLVRRLLRGEDAAPVPDPTRTDGRPLRRDELAPTYALAERPGVWSVVDEARYVEAVARAVEAIRSGDIFQVNLSHRLIAPRRLAPVAFYRRLRRGNPAPFAAYLDLGTHVVASSSPEQFLSLREGTVITRPIKGTRARGYTPEEDAWRRQELAHSAKDRSENVMIVDLLRNDLSRVCRPGTVTVPRLFELERHPTVHHLVSEVRGVLREGRTAPDLLEAAFPGGSITGAPKPRAMETITELEPVARGAYCGSVGWVSFAGDLGTSIAIRTVTIGRGWLQLPAGGGVVADSDPRAEWRETLDKAAGMLRALGD